MQTVTVNYPQIWGHHRGFGKNEKEHSDKHTATGKPARKMERAEMFEVLKNNG